MGRVNIDPISASRLNSAGAVLFDLDGTVVNTIPHILASFRHATKEVLGQQLPDEELMHYVGIPLAAQMRYFTPDEEVAEALLASYRAFNHRTHDEMAKVYPHTRATLEQLHAAGLPMGIVTSKSRMMAERAIDLFKLREFLPVVVTADDTVSHKPEPEPVLLGARLLGIDPDRVVYVGDSPADIAAGKAAGAATIGATWGVASRERLEAAEPDAIADDIGQVPSLVGIQT